MDEILSQIPIRQDLVSFIMVLGIVQGFLLCSVIALRSSRQNYSIRILGWLTLCLSLLSTDVYLCYSGLMKYVIFLNDSTEFMVLLLGPFIYLFIRSLLERKDISLKRDWPHFVLPAIYFLFQWAAMLQTDAFKLNAYVGSYYPELPRIELEYNFLWEFFFFRDNDRWFNLLSFAVYFYLSAQLIYRYRKDLSSNLSSEKLGGKYLFSRNTFLFFLFAGALILTIYLNYENDLGDHFIIILITLSIFSSSFFMLSESRLFEKSWIAEKYETSGLNSDQLQIVERVKQFLQKENYHLREDASLSGLARELDIAPNYLSQSINSQLKQNFNEFINVHRVEEAKKRLLDTAYQHLSIEGIGNSVGFRSKSAFYTAFKKQAGATPAAFVKEKA